MSGPLEDLRAAVGGAAQALLGEPAEGEGASSRAGLERPPRADFGDYSSNVALLLSGRAGRPPRELAQEVAAQLPGVLGPALERVEIAGPGFVNLHLADPWFRMALAQALSAGEEFGSGGAGAGRERIDVEFVSANPTGPLTVASGRHAAFGDAVARILSFHGHEVEREYYVNDWGSQVRRLGESIRARARGEEVPEDGYQGDYVSGLVAPERAREASVEELAREGTQALLDRIRATCERFGVVFDTWFHESSLHAAEGGADDVSRALAVLERAGAVYESEGALWLRTTDHGDDKPRVLTRTGGEHTYFASDIANHQQKLARGFDRLIDVWGADHHGYVRRMQIAMELLGAAPGSFEVLILQFVHLVEGGDRSSMSKRRGDFVTLDDLIDEIGVDAARWFLVSAAPETTIDLDLDLAREHDSKNPVYYVQYAHARIASMLARAGEERVAEALGAGGSGGGSASDSGSTPGEGPEPLHPSERGLVKKLVAFPEEVSEAAARRAPHRLTGYALELAQDFTAFYRDCRVLGAQPPETESWRIALCVASARTIARSLELLGVSAPESM